jgi:hypothetical protein
MLSSLAHVLIVTPIIFIWLRERELRRSPADVAALRSAQGVQAFPTSL